MKSNVLILCRKIYIIERFIIKKLYPYNTDLFQFKGEQIERKKWGMKGVGDGRSGVTETRHCYSWPRVIHATLFSPFPLLLFFLLSFSFSFSPSLPSPISWVMASPLKVTHFLPPFIQCQFYPSFYLIQPCCTSSFSFKRVSNLLRALNPF